MLRVGDFYLEGLSILFSIMTTVDYLDQRGERPPPVMVDYLDQDFAITFDHVHNGRGSG